jgi:hypothetical protein
VLQKRIKASQKNDKLGNLLWEPESDRIGNVVLKLARGHVAYELYPKIENPVEIVFAPLQVMNENKRSAFEKLNPERMDLYPELGTRAFFRAFGKFPDRFEQLGDWIIVQPDRYRYAVTETNGVFVRMVLSEYLACEVIWEI